MVALKSLEEDLCYISTLIDSSFDSSMSVRRLQFLKFEAKHECLHKTENLPEAIERYCQFFFQKKGFVPQATAAVPLSEIPLYSLYSVLNKKTGTPRLIECLFMILSSSIDLNFECLSSQADSILRIRRDLECYYVDLGQQGKILDETEILQKIARHTKGPRKPKTDLFSALSLKELITEILQDLKEVCKVEKEHELHLALLNELIELQPFQIRLLGERALVLIEMGRPKESLKDLKSYFSFHDLNSASKRLVQLYISLLRKMRSNRTNTKNEVPSAAQLDDLN